MQKDDSISKNHLTSNNGLENMVMLSLSGSLQMRFLEAVLLLRALDDVRGVPTVHGLDLKECPSADRTHLLKRKFLDSFALICATHKGGDSVSAACMEESLSEGTTIRIACNNGVRDAVLSNGRDIVEILAKLARGGAFEIFACHVCFSD